MKRFGQVCFLQNDEKRKEYVRLHSAIPKEVAKAIFAANIRNYSIFEKGLYLFSYFEYVGNDYDHDMHEMAQNSAVRIWWDTVIPLMHPLEAGGYSGVWTNMEQIFFQN